VTAEASSAILLRASGGGDRPMFCFHGAGGAVLFFMPVARRLAAHGPVYGVQCHGLDVDAVPDTTMDAMAGRYLRDVLAAGGDAPFRLSGYSIGGVLAHEVARRLLDLGRAVESVTMIDTLYPRPAVARAPGETLELVSIALRFPTLFERESDDFATEAPRFLELAHGYGVVPPEFNERRLRRMVDLYDVNQAVVENHVPERVPVRVNMLYTESGTARDDLADWTKVCGDVDTGFVDAEHMVMMTETYAPEVARIMAAWFAP
jgi:thioesterase domain-containing protein